MKMSKATEKDIDAAGDAMSILNAISSGCYPKQGGDECNELFFDADNTDHLRRFYELMNSTLEASPGWPGRVIGGMCYVILYDKNKIVDPDADTLEIHPQFAEVAQQRDELLEARNKFADWRIEELDKRNELLKALKSLCNRIDTEGATPLYWVEYENALKAAAKAEGGAA